MGKTDVHCHIIPGADDGSKSMDMSMEMIGMAAAQGFDSFFATSHFSPMFDGCHGTALREKLLRLQEACSKKYGEKIRIFPGQELMYCESSMELLHRGEAQTLADSRYVLMEFYPSESANVIRHAVRELVNMGYIPILAHAERYEEIKQEEQFGELIAAGALLQMNYGSLTGGLLDMRAAKCRKLLYNGLIHFLGTDMHDTGRRGPETGKACDWLEKHLDEEYVREITYGNAQRVINNDRIINIGKI